MRRVSSMRLIVLVILLMPSCLLAAIDPPEAAARFESGFISVLEVKIPRLTQDQRQRFARALSEHLEAHEQTFDEQLLERFLSDYSAADPFVIVAQARPRTEQEYALELAVTKAKVDLYVKKRSLDEEERAVIEGQIEELAHFAYESIQEILRSFEGADASQGDHLLEVLARLQRLALDATARSPFHFAFHRPLEGEELRQVRGHWRGLLQREIGKVDIRALIQAGLDELQRLEETGEPYEQQGGRGFPAVRRLPLAVPIAAVVKAVQEPPPTEEEQRASEAYRASLRAQWAAEESGGPQG